MRRYSKDGKLESVVCNCCGKRMAVDHGILREGVMEIKHDWDYFSEKDGQCDRLDVCETCYDEWVSGFVIPVEVEEKKELL